MSTIAEHATHNPPSASWVSAPVAREPRSSQTAEVLRRYIAIFFADREPPPTEDLRAHLRGEAQVEITPRDNQGRTCLGVIEHDGARRWFDQSGELQASPEDGLAVLEEAHQWLALQGLAAALEAAPDGGRLWVFSEPVATADMHALLLLAIRDQAVTVYPPADRHADEPIRAPLGVHPDTGQRYGFLDPTGQPVASTLAGQITYLETVGRVDVAREVAQRPHLRVELAALEERIAARERQHAPDPAAAREADDVAEPGHDQQPTPSEPATSPGDDQPASRHRAPLNPTTRAVHDQVAGMGAERFEVGIKEAHSGRMLIRTWDAAQVEKAAGWLKGQNARGSDIYIRPEGSTGIVLVDDLTAAALRRLSQDGLAPAVITETSPRNYQAWVRVSAGPLPPEVATEVGRELAVRYDADPNSAHWRHFGRLAGYTNLKEKHRQEDGKQPYVLLHEWSGRVAVQAAPLLQAAQERAQLRTQPQPPQQSGLATREQLGVEGKPAPSLVTVGSPLGREYGRRMERLQQRYPGGDLSRLDWMVMRDMARSYPDASQLELMQAMRQGSPRLDERKAGHMDDYIIRTIAKVMQDPEVAHALHRADPREPSPARER